MGRYLKKNSSTGKLLNLWKTKPQGDIWTGPYLCAHCDNVVFSQWEGHYSKSVWLNPKAASTQWGDTSSIRFLVSLLFRYCVHALATSPSTGNRPYNKHFRDLAVGILKDPLTLKSNLFIYPFVYEPIVESCSLITGVNQLLNCSIFGVPLPQEDDLPNAYLLVFPKTMLLICDGNLNSATANEVKPATHLELNKSFDTSSNRQMPEFLHQILNTQIGQGQAHQKSIGLWDKVKYRLDKLLSSSKATYVAAAQDKKLQDWQRTNCRQ